MGSIISIYNRLTSVDSQLAFHNSIQKATKDGRVSSSNLKNLLTGVRNSPAQLTLNQHRDIQRNAQLLGDVLKNQHSKLLTSKHTKIAKALILADQQLTPDAKIERTADIKQFHTTKIIQAVERIKQDIPNLEIRANKASDEVDSMIDCLPTSKSQEWARGLIDNKGFDLFLENSLVTRNLFPPNRYQVETRFESLHWGESDHPDLSTWTSLCRLGMSQAAAQEALSKATAFLNHPDNLTFNEPDSTGNLSLTAHQRALLDFAKISRKLAEYRSVSWGEGVGASRRSF